MGKIVFTVPPRIDLQRRVSSTIHVVGLDGIPWPCKIFFDGRHLSIHRNRDESGHVFFSYALPDYGELVLSTGTLLENDEPYHLTRELARGTLNRLRNQLSLWQEGGLEITADVFERLEVATRFLGDSIWQNDVAAADEAAHESIQHSLATIFRLCQLFGEQVMPLRRERTEQPMCWFGLNLGAQPFQLLERLPCPPDVLQVSRIDAANSSKMGLVLGPFLDASPGGIPENWARINNFDDRQAAILDDVADLLRGPLDRVNVLHVVSGINGMGHRHLSYPQQLQMTLELLSLIERFELAIPTMLSFDTPWAERLAWSVGGVHPLQIADSLLRRGAMISMLGLDINLDYWPNGSLPRDPIQWLDLIDLWSQLGLPLVIRLIAPTQVVGEQKQSSSSGLNVVRGSISDEQLFRLLDSIIPLIQTRPSVHGIIWGQLQDGVDPRFPCGGLLDADGVPKPINSLLNCHLE